MKKVLSIILSIISCLCLFSGCKGWYADQHKFLYEKMSEIPVEYDGYCLKPCIWHDELCVTKGQHIPSYEFVFRDGVLFVQQKNGNYTISYNDFEVVINQSFMEEKSPIYVSINQIWVGKTDALSPARVTGVGVYDEKIFIVTSSLNRGIDKSVGGECPNVLYYYDFENDAVMYCGFYSGEMTAEGLYEGFDGWTDFKINKKIINNN